MQMPCDELTVRQADSFMELDKYNESELEHKLLLLGDGMLSRKRLPVLNLVTRRQHFLSVFHKVEISLFFPGENSIYPRQSYYFSVLIQNSQPFLHNFGSETYFAFQIAFRTKLKAP